MDAADFNAWHPVTHQRRQSRSIDSADTGQHVDAMFFMNVFDRIGSWETAAHTHFHIFIITQTSTTAAAEGFFSDGGRIRGIPVTIGGSSYKPPIPVESIVKEKFHEILTSKKSVIDIAVELCMYSMKTQIFIDGNKRASVIFANHYLIAHGQGLLVIPEEHVPEFKKKLIAYYEGKNIDDIGSFLKEKCWKNF